MAVWNKLVRRSLLIDNDVLPWPGLNMWEDNGLMLRAFYYAKKVSTVDGVYYHYNKLNPGAMSASYGEKQINQMIEIAHRVADFYNDKPDAARFARTVNSLKFYARINLVTDSFKMLRRYYSTFPECRGIIKEIPITAFSRRGAFRYRMVRYHMTWLFVLLFKIYKLVRH